jgi:hypothetical protein
MKTIIITILSIVLTMTVNNASAYHAEISPAIFNLLNKVYGNYDAMRKCWIVPEENDGGHYCMRITKSNIINTEFGNRNYLLLSSNLLDKSGTKLDYHPAAGKVGLFIINLRNTKLLYAKPEISLGSFGTPPQEWNLIKLGPSDYWGWQTYDGYESQGMISTKYLIFAPYGKRGIKQVANIPAYYSDDGTFSYSKVEAKIKVDTSQVWKRVFPLKARLTGNINGKKLRAKTWILPFNTRKWEYIPPKNWPISD